MMYGREQVYDRLLTILHAHNTELVVDSWWKCQKIVKTEKGNDPLTAYDTLVFHCYEDSQFKNEGSHFKQIVIPHQRMQDMLDADTFACEDVAHVIHRFAVRQYEELSLKTVFERQGPTLSEKIAQLESLPRYFSFSALNEMLKDEKLQLRTVDKDSTLSAEYTYFFGFDSPANQEGLYDKTLKETASDALSEIHDISELRIFLWRHNPNKSCAVKEGEALFTELLDELANHNTLPIWLLGDTQGKLQRYELIPAIKKAWAIDDLLNLKYSV